MRQKFVAMLAKERLDSFNDWVTDERNSVMVKAIIIINKEQTAINELKALVFMTRDLKVRKTKENQKEFIDIFSKKMNGTYSNHNCFNYFL